MKILILKPSSLGDVVQALPVLRLLKLHLPKAEIYWWIDASLASLLDGDPDLTGVVRFERRRWVQPRHWPEMMESIRWMRSCGFDWVIDLQGLLRSAAFGWLARGDFLVGLDDSREGANAFYDLAVPRPSPLTHAVDWYLAVLKKLDVPTHSPFIWLAPQPRIATAMEARWPQKSARWIVLQPGARWANKRWPAGHFAKLVQELACRDSSLHFAIIGSASESPLGKAVQEACPGRSLNLCGQTTLPEMVEWIRRSTLLVTNDSGPMHVAAALNRPVVALFGPTDPRRTGPYGQWDHVLRLPLPCSPCLKSTCHRHPAHECLETLTPFMVLEQVSRLLTPPPAH